MASSVTSTVASDDEFKATVATASTAKQGAAELVTTVDPRNERRKIVSYQGSTVYEWQQSLDEVEVFVTPPKGITAKMLDVKMTANSLQIGIKKTKPFIAEPLGGKIDLDESVWTFEDGTLHISLQKAHVGETWSCALQGAMGKLSAEQVQADQQKILLERFGKEHPGFDFSQAQFNGEAPDARKFLGGISQVKK